MLKEANRSGKVAIHADEDFNTPLYAMAVMLMMLLAICQIFF